MGVLYELRQVPEEEAVAFVRAPALFIQMEQAKQEEARKCQPVIAAQEWDSRKEFTAISTERHYSWKLLRGLIAVSDEAVDLLESVDSAQN